MMGRPTKVRLPREAGPVEVADVVEEAAVVAGVQLEEEAALPDVEVVGEAEVDVIVDEEGHRVLRIPKSKSRIPQSSVRLRRLWRMVYSLLPLQRIRNL
jgi:hypothetical protein